jgi:hypothetical protein
VEEPKRLGDGYGEVIPWLALLPGLAAIGLALLYGVGAILVVAQLIGAHLTVGTLVLVPLEQILARGIGTVVVSSVVVPLLAVTAWSAVTAERRTERSISREKEASAEARAELDGVESESASIEAESAAVKAELEALRQLARDPNADPVEIARDFSNLEARLDKLHARSEGLKPRVAELDHNVTRQSRRVRRTLFVVRTGAATGVAAMLAVSLFLPVWFLAFVVPFAVAITLVWRQRHRFKSPLAVLYATSLTLSFVTVIGAEFIEPPPLPRVVLSLESGQTLSGRLVVQRTDSWVVTQSKRRLRVVPTQQVTTAAVTQPPPEPQNSMYELLTGNQSPIA